MNARIFAMFGSWIADNNPDGFTASPYFGEADCVAVSEILVNFIILTQHKPQVDNIHRLTRDNFPTGAGCPDWGWVPGIDRG